MVTDNAARGRFELELAGGTAFLDYQYRDDKVRVLTHAEVPLPFRGAGVGAQLVSGALDLARARGEKVVPRCPYVAHFMRRHTQYADLLAG
jgi:hypothetical protein